MTKKILIKIGTNVITKGNGLLDVEIMRRIVKQIAQLKKKGIQVILVSSGAMGAGRSLVKLKDKVDQIKKRQILAAVGQVKLVEEYEKLFQKHDIIVSQVLATKEDFRDRQHYLNMKHCFDGLLEHNIVPIVNENDVVSVSELMFTDNDELAGLVAAMMDCDSVILLTIVDGLKDKDGKIISNIVHGEITWKKEVRADKSSFGRGGMITKCNVASKLASVGIPTYIVNGKTDRILINVLDGRQVGTKFEKSKHVSSVKKWIAYSQGQEKGTVYLNECGEPALRDKNARSLLPVGITKVEGSFEKGDIIKIRNHKGKDIGLGKAEYSSDLAKKYAGKKGKKALVHYDYLFLN